MDDIGRISPMRRAVLAVVALGGITLTATSIVHPVATHPNVTATANRGHGREPAHRCPEPAGPPGPRGRCRRDHGRPTLLPPASPVPRRSPCGPGSIPSTVLAAYRKAAATLAVEDQSCHLTWPVLAGIGKVETDHGRSWGAAARHHRDRRGRPDDPRPGAERPQRHGAGARHRRRRLRPEPPVRPGGRSDAVRARHLGRART